MRSALAFGVLFSVALAVQSQTPTPTPYQVRGEVVVVANRLETRIEETPASVVSFQRTQIDSTVAPTLDDMLRQSAGFSIFRRSSSRNSNPTTQGVSLRGVGATGASRTAILFDGVPLNDPFGGWVQWNRVTPIAIDRVEVLRGGASSLYGNSGLSGAVNIRPREPDTRLAAALDVFGGSMATTGTSAFVGYRPQDWAFDVSSGVFHTRGYRPIDEAVRGPIDGLSGSRSSNFSVKLARRFGNDYTLFVRPSYFGEVRTNGTALQTNRTHIRQFVTGGNASLSDFSLEFRLFGGLQVFDQIFSAVATDRASEIPTRLQRVPANHLGLSVQGRVVVGGHTLVGGLDSRNIRGSSDEIAFANSSPTARIDAGGRERVTGLFIQDFARLGARLVLAGSVRYDRWDNYSGFTSSRPLSTNVTTTTHFPDRTEDALSPQISVLVRASDTFSAYAAASHSYRSPTLNELYRAFRVGNVLTLANENLRAENARNFEIGATISRRQLRVRANGFVIDIEDAIANVTMNTAPNLITRQRQNAGRTHSVGLEVEAEILAGRSIVLNASYLYADSRVIAFPSNTQLVDRVIPQIAKHQIAAQMRLSRGKWSLAAQARASGRQFDDDLNLFSLEPYAQLDVFASRRLKHRLQVYSGIENVFGTRYSIGRTPFRTVSLPLSVRAGIRWR